MTGPDHRVWNIYAKGAERTSNYVEVVLGRKDLWISDGMQWDAISRRTTETWGDCLAQINESLQADRSHAVDMSEKSKVDL